jgi:hypothetical protein
MDGGLAEASFVAGEHFSAADITGETDVGGATANPRRCHASDLWCARSQTTAIMATAAPQGFRAGGRIPRMNEQLEQRRLVVAREALD